MPKDAQLGEALQYNTPPAPCYMAPNPLSPGSLLYVLYVLYLTRQPTEHPLSPGSLLYVLYVLYLTEHPLSPGSLLYVLYVLYGIEACILYT